MLEIVYMAHVILRRARSLPDEESETSDSTSAQILRVKNERSE
jgi:hypothetical protein